MEQVINASVILSVVGALVVLTNIVTQVIKQFLWKSVPTNFVVSCVAIVLTLAAFIAYSQIKNITVTWYMVFGAVVLGILVAYAAMFGFDKLKEALGKIGKP